MSIHALVLLCSSPATPLQSLVSCHTFAVPSVLLRPGYLIML